MGTGQVDTSVQARESRGPDGWPELIYTPVFLLYEHGQWYAIATRFNIVAVGSSVTVAWNEMQELTCEYFRICAQDGLSFAQVIRPMRWHRRAALYLRWWAGSILPPLFRDRRPREHELVVAPSLNGQHATC